MPTYVYECSACNTVFEIEQRIIENSLDTCIKCGSKGTVKRIIQPVGISFKGSGFHINDYSPSKGSEAPKDDAPKTEAAPAAITEPSTPAAAPAVAPTPAPSSTSSDS